MMEQGRKARGATRDVDWDIAALRAAKRPAGRRWRDAALAARVLADAGAAPAGAARVVWPALPGRRRVSVPGGSVVAGVATTGAR